MSVTKNVILGHHLIFRQSGVIGGEGEATVLMQHETALHGPKNIADTKVGFDQVVWCAVYKTLSFSGTLLHHLSPWLSHLQQY